LPASAADVAAFVAGERGRQLLSETLKLHHAASGPVPTDDVCISKTMTVISREAAKQDAVARKKVAATATILRRLLAPIADDLCGLRNWGVLLGRLRGALRRSELAAIRFEHLGKTDRGLRLTLPQTNGADRRSHGTPRV
jgi:hypothetical protein